MLGKRETYLGTPLVRKTHMPMTGPITELPLPCAFVRAVADAVLSIAGAYREHLGNEPGEDWSLALPVGPDGAVTFYADGSSAREVAG